MKKWTVLPLFAILLLLTSCTYTEPIEIQDLIIQSREMQKQERQQSLADKIGAEHLSEIGKIKSRSGNEELRIMTDGTTVWHIYQEHGKIKNIVKVGELVWQEESR